VLLGGIVVYLTQRRRPVVPAFAPPLTPPVPPSASPAVSGLPTAPATVPFYLHASTGQRYPLALGSQILGRASDCAIRIADEKLSRHHARLHIQDKWITIEDKSVNGTFVNGQRIAGPATLHSGDSIRCGTTTFMLQSAVEAPARATSGACLQIQTGLRAGETWYLMAPRVTIGRGQSNDLILPDERVSRHHACIEQGGQQFILSDLGSSTGTLVNGQPVTQHPLQPGEVVQLGNTQMRFELGVIPRVS